MSAHLAHKLPWSAITDVFMHVREHDGSYRRPKSFEPHEERKLRHFATCLAAAVNEFRATDRSPVDESDEYDPEEWRLETYQACWPYEHSITMGYLLLNLLLLDNGKFLPRICNANGINGFFQCMGGDGDDGHPTLFANHIAQAFHPGTMRLKPRTTEVRTT